MSWFSRKKETEVKTMPAKKSSEGDTARDPVCGMNVKTGSAPATATYQGKTYYFCAPGCQKTFEADPAKYLDGKSHSGGHCCQ